MVLRFFWVFPSDRIPKGTKGVNVNFFLMFLCLLDGASL